MTNRVKLMLGVVFALTALALRGLPQDSARLVIRPEVMTYLGHIVDTATVEHGRCLIGFSDADSIVIDGVAESPWLEGPADSLMAVYQFWNCPSAAFAWWHTHLPLKSIPAEKPEDRCYLSSTHYIKIGDVDSIPAGDMPIALNPLSPPIAMVSVSSSVWCVFARFKDQDGEWKVRRIPTER